MYSVSRCKKVSGEKSIDRGKSSSALVVRIVLMITSTPYRMVVVFDQSFE